jgi:hypothetical protein
MILLSSVDQLNDRSSRFAMCKEQLTTKTEHIAVSRMQQQLMKQEGMAQQQIQ